MATKQSQSTEITRVASAEQLRNVKTFNDAIALFRDELGAQLVESKELGDGFTLLDDKDALIGKPCMFLSWTFTEGDFGEFVTARVIAEMAPNTYSKFVVNDGSTGICSQLQEMEGSGARKFLYAPRGLRRSDFKFPDPGTGEMKPAHTFYIDTSATPKGL